MSIKYLFTKTRLTNTDIVIHLLVIVILGILVAYTNKKEHFLNPASVDYKMSPLNQKERPKGQQVDAAIFYKEPKKFTGGELFFPRHNYELTCENNSIIILPGWVTHGVKEVKIEDSVYYDGWGRYSITSFFTNMDQRILNELNESDTI